VSIVPLRTKRVHRRCPNVNVGVVTCNHRLCVCVGHAGLEDAQTNGILDATLQASASSSQKRVR
jgi:hypothetical protein